MQVSRYLQNTNPRYNYFLTWSEIIFVGNMHKIFTVISACSWLRLSAWNSFIDCTDLYKTSADLPDAVRMFLLDICQPGQYSDDGLGPCFLCPIGLYNMEYKQTACVSCPPGLTTATEGSSSNTDCMIIETGSQKGTPGKINGYLFSIHSVAIM